MDWIRTLGGPIICLPATSMTNWGGIFRLSGSCESARTDYDRACLRTKFLTVLPVAGVDALVLNSGGSVDTSIGRTASGALVIVQVIYSEPDIDEDALFGNLDDAIFIDPAEAVEISFGSADLVMFDTADPGDDIESGMKSFRLDPGSYKVSAKMFSPDLTFGSVLYKFERVVEPKEG